MYVHMSLQCTYNNGEKLLSVDLTTKTNIECDGCSLVHKQITLMIINTFIQQGHKIDQKWP